MDFDVTITLEQVIPIGARAMPYFWVSGSAVEEFEESIDSDLSVEEIH